jgi:hypothetical protein
MKLTKEWRFFQTLGDKRGERCNKVVIKLRRVEYYGERSDEDESTFYLISQRLFATFYAHSEKRDRPPSEVKNVCN